MSKRKRSNIESSSEEDDEEEEESVEQPVTRQGGDLASSINVSGTNSIGEREVGSTLNIIKIKRKNIETNMMMV